ncbi:hypothetical protein J2X46_000858, partial [Nocardioides sp. BE266]|nr:hypothetical protein [Nocardioides sp. BE266]
SAAERGGVGVGLNFHALGWKSIGG